MYSEHIPFACFWAWKYQLSLESSQWRSWYSFMGEYFLTGTLFKPICNVFVYHLKSCLYSYTCDFVVFINKTNLYEGFEKLKNTALKWQYFDVYVLDVAMLYIHASTKRLYKMELILRNMSDNLTGLFANLSEKPRQRVLRMIVFHTIKICLIPRELIFLIDLLIEHSA